jgi:tripartite-type tricarboxylate transporter receptor subunit TctC
MKPIVAAILAIPAMAGAQTYPAKPIRMVMTLGAGGSAEIAARLLAQKVSDSVGQPVLVEPGGGAGGAIGATTVMRAAPDGYTILFGTTGALVLRKFIVKDTPYDTLRDFTPLMQLGETVSAIAATMSIPGNTLPEVLEYVKKNPGKLSYGSTGIGTTHHLSGEMISMLTGVKWEHVPYKNSNQAVLDTVTGRIHLMFTTLGSMQPQITAGKLKLLALNNVKRFHRAPGVPTVQEVLPGYDRPPSWVGLLGPAGMPQPTVQRLYTELSRAGSSPEVVEKLDEIGILADPKSPGDFTAFIKANFAAVDKLMKQAGIQPE